MSSLVTISVSLIALTSGCCGICHHGGVGHGQIVDAGACGDGCCDAGCGPGVRRSCAGLKKLLHPFRHCGSGCGEIYWNEWMCDPPDCCDPCDSAGYYVGRHECCHIPHLIASTIHFVGRGVSDLLGAILGGIGCGPCAILNCGGCGACASCCGPAVAGGGVIVDDGGACCANADLQVPTGAVIQESHHPVQLSASPQSRSMPHQYRSTAQQIRLRHGRSPHRVVSRRIQ